MLKTKLTTIHIKNLMSKRAFPRPSYKAVKKDNIIKIDKHSKNNHSKERVKNISKDNTNKNPLVIEINLIR